MIVSRLRAVRTRLAREERGAVVVLVAVAMPVMLLLLSFVVDVGNWFEHRRHLQTQADAAALAAVGDVLPCGTERPRVEARIEEYGKVRNPQVGNTPAERVAWRLNHRQWEWQDGAGHPVDDTVVEGDPCVAGMIDVKMTERDLPWWLNATRDVDFINVRARVRFFELTTLGHGALPVAVPDVNPSAVRVWFVDETTTPPTPIPNSSKLLKLRKSADGTPAIENGQQIWDNAADNSGTPLSLAVPSRNVGMRVAMSQDGATTECGQPLVLCYDATSQNGIVHIRGHASGPPVVAGAPPELRDAWLIGNTCADGYLSSGGCTIHASARVSFAAAGTTAEVEAVTPAGTTPMAYDTVTGRWRTAAPVTVATGATVPVGIRVHQQSGAVNGATCVANRRQNPAACVRTFDNVQRHQTLTDERSGPIRSAVVSNAAGTWANSLERCTATQTICTHELTIRLGFYAGVQGAASPDSDPVSLRVAGGGSQNQSLDCDPELPSLKDEIAAGCAPSYTVNTTDACPAGNQDLWALAQPWNCVGIQTGAAVNQVPAGMNLRVLGDEKARVCTSPNQWPEVYHDPSLLADDPRLVAVFITPYASFAGSGSGTVPVRNFAYFYVTGWAGSGGGFSNPCEANGDDPAAAGEITGHFVKYLQRLNDGSGSTTACNFNSPTPCVAQMTD